MIDFEAAETAFEQRREAGLAGALVARAGGQPAYSAVAGEAGRGLPFSDQTAVDIASISKPVTSMAILKLAEQGKLGLDDRLDRWFPEAPPDKKAITLRQLLSHSAGIANFVEGVSDYTQISAQGMARGLLDTPLKFTPSERWSYRTAASTCSE